MSTAKPRSLLRLQYARAARAYERALPPEHYMEATSQATQRTITLESLDLVRARRADFHLFNELLVQYPYGRPPKIRGVVPDNMVVISDQPIKAAGTFDVPFQPVGPFWVLEYVSKHSKRKDYEDNFRKYERELKVPYYLLFNPEPQELTLDRLTDKRYTPVTANAAGRLALPELDLEMALLEGWVRFWHQGRLLPLPAELDRELDKTRRELRHAQEQTRHAQEQVERLQAQLRKLGIEPK